MKKEKHDIDEKYSIIVLYVPAFGHLFNAQKTNLKCVPKLKR